MSSRPIKNFRKEQKSSVAHRSTIGQMLVPFVRYLEMKGPFAGVRNCKQISPKLRRGNLGPRSLQTETSSRKIAVRSLLFVLLGCLSISVIVIICYRSVGARFSSQYFRIDGLRITGNSRLSKEEIQNTLAWVANSSTVPCPKESVKSALLKHGWIESVSVYCELPNILSLNVKEHDAIGAILFEGESEKIELLNAKGRPMKVASSSERTEWPVITGIAREYFENDIESVSLEIKRILSSVQKYASLPSRPRLSQIDIQGSDIVLFTEFPRLAVHIGSELDDRKLIYFDQVLQTFGTKISKIERVFLDQSVYRDRVVVRFVNRKDKTLLNL